MTPSASRSGIYDLVIVGAGPAGLAAAEIAVAHKARTLIVDMQPRAGGQFLRPPPKARRPATWLRGRMYQQARSLLERMEDHPDLTWRFGTTVVGIEPAQDGAGNRDPSPSALILSAAAALECVYARRVIVAAGCFELPLHFPGWTTPGVMSAGAMQTLVKSGAGKPAHDVLLAGTHPLILIAAEQLLAAGVLVRGVVFAQTFSKFLRLALSPVVVLRNSAKLAPILGTICRLWLRRVPLRFCQAPVLAEADPSTGQLSRVKIAVLKPSGRPDRSRSYRVDSNTLGICYGFQAATELCRQAGAAIEWSPHNGGWIVNTDDFMRTSVNRLYAAGEQTGQHGADAAITKGQLAALGVMIDSNRIDVHCVDRHLRKLRRRLARQTRFAEALNAVASPSPDLTLLIADRDTLICRCEAVTAGVLDNALGLPESCGSANALKSLSRVEWACVKADSAIGRLWNLLARERVRLFLI